MLPRPQATPDSTSKKVGKSTYTHARLYIGTYIFIYVYAKLFNPRKPQATGNSRKFKDTGKPQEAEVQIHPKVNREIPGNPWKRET